MSKLRILLLIIVFLLLFCIFLLRQFSSEHQMAERHVSSTESQFKESAIEMRKMGNRIDVVRDLILDLMRQKLEVPPKWIERYSTPLWSEFKPWRGVFVFFVSYRTQYLRKCLASIAVASKDIDKSSVCVFALDRTPKTTEQDVKETLEAIDDVSVCQTYVWVVKKKAQKGKLNENYVLRLKLHWWFVLETVYNATYDETIFNGLLHGYERDILFLEEDAVLSPDFVKVMWYSSEIKRRNKGILQFALGGWAGENMINAHPDTFVVRTSRALRGIAYGLNQSTWLYFKSLEMDFFADKQDDWCESMGLVLGKHNDNTGFRIVVPTLSRLWHVGKSGLGPSGDFLKNRGVTPQPNWELASRLINLQNAKVNLGLRDLLGFLCKKRIEFGILKDTICPNSMARWKGEDRTKIMCFKHPYVQDPCDAILS
ncbi:uncharacterized protein LOC124451129 isoform X1 [Xenia sp. Carnegie-2017]|uniref:uncharacterized protein LOC124451129 isoform X1 n=2 Tax=Xenia sp. Carnegie-2017 TaxID=2897299 RepID=UPI001F03BDE8|nr:uncharacterized protein LOC124451129 isoform X1 [Xenia sp. Carnegie-2017]